MNFETLKNTEKSLELKELYHQTTVYINAGGRGTRLEPLMPKGEKGITKALLKFDNTTLIERHLDLLTKFDFSNIIVGAGDHQDIEQHLEKHKFNNVTINNVDVQEDTGSDLIEAIRNCRDCKKNILVENVDTLLVIKDIDALLRQHHESGATGTIVLTTKKNVPNEGAFFVEQNGKVIYSQEARASFDIQLPENWDGFRGSSTGLVIFKTDFLTNHSWQSGDQKLSVYRDLIPELIKRGELYAYNNKNNLFVDIGTPKPYKQIKRRERKIFNAIGDRYLKNNK